MFENGQIAAPLILIVTIGVSLIGLYQAPRIIDVCLFRPYHFLRDKQFDTMILSGFVHADVGHLLFNMFTFYFFAFPMERIVGTVPFLLLYFFGLVISHTCTWYKHRNNPGYASLGASGAISAVLFAYIIYDPTSTIMILPIPVPIRATNSSFLWVALLIRQNWRSCDFARCQQSRTAILGKNWRGVLVVFSSTRIVTTRSNTFWPMPILPCTTTKCGGASPWQDN